MPLPGGLPGTPNPSKATTLPAVTQATFQKGGGMDWGRLNDSRYIAMNINLVPNGAYLSQDMDVTDTRLVAEGIENTPQQFDAMLGTSRSNASNGWKSTTWPFLIFRVLDHEPGKVHSSMGGGDSQKAEMVAALPRRKIHIRGTLMLNKNIYRPIHRGSLEEPFIKKENGTIYAYSDPMQHYSQYESAFIWKSYKPALLTASSYLRREYVSTRIEGPMLGDENLVPRFYKGGGGLGGFFGSYNYKELRYSDHEIASIYEGLYMLGRGYQKPIQEWRKEAQLVCEVVDKIEALILPVDVEVEVPDPVKVRELLLEGKL